MTDDSEGWTDRAPTEPGWYWIYRVDRKAMPVEVLYKEFDPGAASKEVLKDWIPGKLMPPMLMWRAYLGDHFRPLETVKRWGPKLPEMKIPDWVAVTFALEGVNQGPVSQEEFAEHLKKLGLKSAP